MQCIALTKYTRQLSYRKEERAMRPTYGCTEKFWESSLRTRLLFQKFVTDFVPIDTKNERTKLEVRSFTRSWDNRGYSKNLGSPWIRPRSILFGWTLWIYLPNLKFVALPVPEIIGGTQKFGQSLYTPTLHFLPNFKLAFVRMDPLNISAKFDVRSFTHSWDNRGTQKIWAVPGFANPPYSAKFLKGFCSHGPCEYNCQVWSS